MAAKTATSPKRKSYANRVRALIISMFGLSKQDWVEQNKAWNNWFTLEDRDRHQHEVEALLKRDVKDAFKARVLAILFAPQAGDVPFVGGEHHNSDLGLMIDESARLSDLPTTLRAFAIALIGIYTSAVKDCPRYRTQILDALKILPHEDPTAAQLFERYPLVDIMQHPDDRPDCHSFGELLYSKQMSEKWKRFADTKMRKIISVDEKRRPIIGRSVIEQYAYHIMAYPDSTGWAGGVDRFASQIDFLLRFPNLRGYYLFPDHQMKKILDRIGGDAHADLRLRFARRVMHDEGGAINDANVHAIAVKLLEEFGERDPELGEKLRSAIANADKYKREQRAAARKRRARDNALLARMR
jgi:hypothetical protein